MIQTQFDDAIAAAIAAKDFPTARQLLAAQEAQAAADQAALAKAEAGGGTGLTDSRLDAVCTILLELVAHSPVWDSGTKQLIYAALVPGINDAAVPVVPVVPPVAQPVMQGQAAGGLAAMLARGPGRW